MKVGFFIPEFPGQTHSFFWREIEQFVRQPDARAQIVSTRLPPRPVSHDWVLSARADYLYPLPIRRLPALIGRLVIALPRFLHDADSRRLVRTAKTWGLLLFALRLHEICRERHIDHLHVHSCGNSALIAAFLNRLTGMPYSLVLHGPIEDYGREQPYKWKNAAFVFVITEKLRAEVAEKMPEMINRVTIVPMGVDTDRFRPLKPDGPKPAKTWRWFSCARLNRVKGFDILIAAVAQLAEDPTLPKFHLFIAGEDDQGGIGYRKALEQEIRDRNLGEYITLLGALTQEHVLKQLQSADGFVLASRHEPLGVAYMEAMACQLPTIGTRAGGVEELITDGRDGILVPPEDPTELANSMTKIMREPETAAALGRVAREKIVSDFSAARSATALGAALKAGGVV